MNIEGKNYRVEPKYTGTTVQDHLIFLRDTFSDSIPERVINSGYTDNRYKVRKNWWAGLLRDMEDLVEEGTVGAEDRQIITDFIQQYWTPEFMKRERLTRREDIEKAVTLINHLVANEENDPMVWRSDPPFQLRFTK